MPKGVYPRTPAILKKITASLPSNITHGHTTGGQQSKLYNTWHCMIQRCGNPKVPNFPDYGGRGITVCEQWRKFENFLEYILEHLGERPAGMSLDRIDNDGNYEPGNVRWATRREQALNQRFNSGRYVEGRRVAA